MLARFCSFFQRLSSCRSWRKHPGARWPLPVLLDKKSVILEGLAFLRLPCWGWGAEALLFAEVSQRQ